MLTAQKRMEMLEIQGNTWILSPPKDLTFTRLTHVILSSIQLLHKCEAIDHY